MSTTAKEAKWPLIVNLTNSIIGVSILAQPFCLKQCGIILGALLLLASNILTRVTCHLLMKSSYLCRKRSYEYLALHVFGPTGKTLVEAFIVLFMLSTLCAFFVLIGDLGPHVVVDFLALESVTPQLRISVMVVIGVSVILPLSLLRNIESLNHVSSTAIIFYAVFVLRMFLQCLPHLLALEWIDQVNWWRPGGVLQCLPIYALGLSCQTQLFVLSECMDEPSPHKMDAVVSGAVSLCSSVYLSVGFFGYVAFYDQLITGDILVLLESTYLTQLLKIGFLLSVAVSFPLMLFPCRIAIYTMFFRPTPPSSHDISVEVIPDGPFRSLTVSLLSINLIIAILIPNVEFVLGITGSLIGSTICVIIPAIIFLLIAPETQFYSRIAAQICLAVGLFILVVCTFATLHAEPAPHEIPAQEIEQPKIMNQTPAPAVPMEGKQGERSPEKAAVDTGQEAQRKEPAVPVQPQGAADPKVVEKRQIEPKLPEIETKDKQAAHLLSELKQQQVEQKKLIEEQKELIQHLKDHHLEHKSGEQQLQNMSSDRAENDAPNREILEVKSPSLSSVVPAVAG